MVTVLTALSEEALALCCLSAEVETLGMVLWGSGVCGVVLVWFVRVFLIVIFPLFPPSDLQSCFRKAKPVTNTFFAFLG